MGTTASTQDSRRLFAKLALRTGVPYAVLMAFYYGYRGDNHPIVKALVFGIMASGIFSVVFGGSQWFASRRMGVPGVLDVVQQATVVVAGDVAQAVSVVRGALEKMSALEVQGSSNSLPELTARVPRSWRSSGELMRFEFHSKEKGYTEIRVSSRPGWRTVLIDFGSNLANIRAFRRAVERNAGDAATGGASARR